MWGEMGLLQTEQSLSCLKAVAATHFHLITLLQECRPLCQILWIFSFLLLSRNPDIYVRHYDFLMLTTHLKYFKCAISHYVGKQNMHGQALTKDNQFATSDFGKLSAKHYRILCFAHIYNFTSIFGLHISSSDEAVPSPHYQCWVYGLRKG